MLGALQMPPRLLTLVSKVGLTCEDTKAQRSDGTLPRPHSEELEGVGNVIIGTPICLDPNSFQTLIMVHLSF